MPVRALFVFILFFWAIPNAHSQSPAQFKADKDKIEIQLRDIYAKIGLSFQSKEEDRDQLAEWIFEAYTLEKELKAVALKYYQARFRALRTYADFDEALQELEEDRLFIGGDSRKDRISTIQADLLSIRCATYSETGCASQVLDLQSLEEFLNMAWEKIAQSVKFVYVN